MISVILPAYNAQDTIAEAIQSIVDQTYEDWELIIINDGSTDGTKSVIQTFKDNRIKFYDNLGNKGLVFTLNRALSIARGFYIARMDADDISLPTRFEMQINYIEKYNLDLIGCMIERIDMDGNCVIPISHRSYPPTTITRCLRYDNCIAHPSWLGRKVIFEELGGYRNFHACEDYDFLLRAVHRNFKLGVCDSIQLKYRENFNGISISNLFKQRLSAKYLRDNLNNIDDLTEVDLNNYLLHHNTLKQKNKYIEGMKFFNEGLISLRQKKMRGAIEIIKGAFISRYVYACLIDLFIIQIIKGISLVSIKINSLW